MTKAIRNNSKQKKILFIEANLDGTIGGSHYCLLELVKCLNKDKFKPYVLFFQDNALIPNFEQLCPTIIFDKTKGFIIKNRFPRKYLFISKYKFLLSLLLLCQKGYNFFRYSII